MRQKLSAINIVAEWPPGPGNELPRLVEIEDDHGNSVHLGDWRERTDGLWVLRIPLPAGGP